ncbi:MAG TPA: F0F1 ATP synthase subunit epsilon [Polyangia bacterium]|nr:F0F1 ATP synthase subunit epsilon [Polyangia bacterium]
MRLAIVTPLEIATTAEGVVHVRAEDSSGGFGIQPHHAPLVTTLPISVVSWRRRDGEELHCAVRGAVLSVSGDTVSVATREAVVDRDLERLEHEVLARFRRATDESARVRVDEERLRATAIRNIQRLLRPARRSPAFGGQS